MTNFVETREQGGVTPELQTFYEAGAKGCRPALPLDVVSNRNQESELHGGRQQNKRTKPKTQLAAKHYASVTTAMPLVLGADVVRLEVSLHRGLPLFELVGLPSSQAQSVKSRVMAAIKNSGYVFPDQRIIASVAPGGHYLRASAIDLPLALVLLAASGQIGLPNGLAVVGELSLSGECSSLPSAYNLYQALYLQGFKNIISGEMNREEAALVPCNFTLFSSLHDCSSSLSGIENLDEMKTSDLAVSPQDNGFSQAKPKLIDLPGQYMTRLGLQIAVAGRHHLIMIGGPGCGKSSLARLSAYLMPDLSAEEQQELMTIYSSGGNRIDASILACKRPFRSPHYEISRTALLGGGSLPAPGEISLSHHGVLFLDELTEYPASNLDALRTALSEGNIQISRSRGRLQMPAEIILIGACNPCPCGNYFEADRQCTCKPYRIQQKLGKLSGPFCDRIDLFVEMRRIPDDELVRTIKEGQLCDVDKMKHEVETAIEIQRSRYALLRKPETNNSNIESAYMVKYFCINSDALRMAEKLAQVFKLSVRGFHKLLRVGRTIADLDQSEQLRTAHVSLAAQFKMRDYIVTTDSYVP